jgi:hypothetical protein
MANWYYYNESGEKIEVTGGQLKGLAKSGVITPDTMIETEDGKTAPARKVKGLTFGDSVQSESASSVSLPTESIPIEQSPPSQSAPTTAPTPGSYCTHCGQPVHPAAAACMACGADPRVHRKFCGSCGTPINEVQVICTRCQTPVSSNTGTVGVPIAQTPGNVVSPTQPTKQPLGTVLASGNGKWNPIIFGNWVVTLLLAVAFCFLLGFVFTLMLLIVAIPYLVFSTRGIAKTEITVYENGITGTIGKSLFELQSFHITYSEIAKVDVLGLTAIVIHAGVQYKCYVANPAEMRRVIVEQQQKYQQKT